MASVYITFGQTHAHRVNDHTFDKDCVAKVSCKDYADGRRKAFELFDNKWHNCYSDKEFDNDIMKYFPRGILEAN